MAVSRSNRQVNDWLNRRKNKRTRHLDTNLTGKAGNVYQAFTIRILREWIEFIPPGDSIAIRCESAKPDKQFRVWKKWFLKHEDKNWDVLEEDKSFFFYKKKYVE
jgi:hypothetical protein